MSVVRTPVTHHLSRRSTLRLACAGTLGTLAMSATTACEQGESKPEPPDPLIVQQQSAAADAAAATAAIAVLPDRAAALKVIAAERTAHAEALRIEVARAAGVYRDGTTPTPEPQATTAAAPAPIPPPTLAELRDRIAASRRSAAELANTLSTYRAGLLGSISASCAAQVEVQLA